MSGSVKRPMTELRMGSRLKFTWLWILSFFALMSAFIHTTLSQGNRCILISEVELNPPGNDLHSDVYEWVELYNSEDRDVDLTGWTLSTTHGRTVTVVLSGVIPAHGYYVYEMGKQWLDNENESVVLRDPNGFEIDRTPTLSDDENDRSTWQRCVGCRDFWFFRNGTKRYENDCCFPTPSPNRYVWKDHLNTTKLGESGIVINVVDGDTIDVKGVGRVRFADINTPERGEEGYEEAKEFVEKMTLGKKVYLDIDDFCITGKYGRIIAVVYAPYGNDNCFVNLNQLLLKEGYAKISDYYNEFCPYEWNEPEIICLSFGESSKDSYPSISGTFIGTIKPNKEIIANELYIYPCIGTGGHAEYAEIWNSTWSASAMWEGYSGDWHNISFNKTVFLIPNETYNITIKTGSYPQIHHTSSLQTESGWINCTEFRDANGRIYYNWIPAFRLFFR